MPKSESYNASVCCGEDCALLDANDDQPCWGDVEVVEEESDEVSHWWIHSCQGHIGHRHGDAYKQEAAGDHRPKTTA